MTPRYLRSTSGELTSCCQVSECFIHFSSSRYKASSQYPDRAHEDCRYTNLREVLASVRTTRLLTSGGGSNGLDGALENVAELEGLNEVTIGAKN